MGSILLNRQDAPLYFKALVTLVKGPLGLRQGDVLVITSWHSSESYTLTNNYDSTGRRSGVDMVNNILIEVLSNIAKEERRTIRRRQQEGILAVRFQRGSSVFSRIHTIVEKMGGIMYNGY